MPIRHAPRPSRWQMPLLLLLVAWSLAAGIGLREPMPADEPRFVLSARAMVESGDWMFPRRGSELYADKPPAFMWLQAASYLVVRDWRLAFLLPSLLAALATLWLAGDLARRLWGRRAMPYAVFGLFVCLQFALQARRAQIDMVLVGMTTLSLWALLRYLLETPKPRLLALGTFAAGLGTVTKGVGFLPLLLLLPWAWLRRTHRRGRDGPVALHLAVAAGGFALGAGLWLAPMLAATLTSGDPALHAYARDILLRQTGARYVEPWMHVKPAWYYLQAMLTLWLPGVLLLPWLLPAWWRRLRRRDPRLWLLLGWSLLVLAFFTASAGKREVYIFPVLPALCVAAAPLLPGLLRRRGVRAVLWGYLIAVALAAAGLGGWLLAAPPPRLQGVIDSRGLSIDAVRHIGGALLAFAAVALAVVATTWRITPRRPAPALLLVTAALWTTQGLGIMPALSPAASAQALMRDVGATIGPDAELALLGWREQHLLQADRAATDFGFSRPWADQWRDAAAWLQADPGRRWLFVEATALVPCVDAARTLPAGDSNRRRWVLVPGTAWRAGCVPDPVPTER